MLISIICKIAESAIRTDDVNFELYWWACQWHNARAGYVENSLTLKLLLLEQDNEHHHHPVSVPAAAKPGSNIPHP
ncbi:gp021 [Erwinia phage vB_EamP-S6]|uniref:Gp021 n=1 Tax=Erwinia phage vB_EamP-S6 TaxID=1051675 RepID=G0YQB3_9CAUD|nr:gp021 [Erwinia phage vB_EamP-S6]AEJ81540.1 gp021 [Erwinia phage vB_EamP-S6]